MHLVGGRVDRPRARLRNNHCHLHGFLRSSVPSSLIYPPVKALYSALAIPLSLSVWFVGFVYYGFLDDRTNPLVPLYEHRLNERLLCRAYPKWHDSILADRLSLLRETGHWFKNEVVESIH